MGKDVWTLGLHGGVNHTGRHLGDCGLHWQHDAAAAICRNGEVVAAYEEERLIRLKHTNFLPLESIRNCVAYAGISVSDIDHIVVASHHSETYYARVVPEKYSAIGRIAPPNYRAFVADVIGEALAPINAVRISVINHHLAHLFSVYPVSGFDKCLAVILDGSGDDAFGAVYTCVPGNITERSRIQNTSFGFFYLTVTQWLGFKMHDEYKVMGLAPWGNPTEFREQLSRVYRSVAAKPIAPRDKYAAYVRALEDEPTLARAKRSPRDRLDDVHRDLAAALQAVLEDELLLFLKDLRSRFDFDDLVLAGGVSQNCAANGRLAKARIFERIFLHSAGYDAGCALGAALSPFHDAKAPQPRSSKSFDLFLGNSIPSRPSLVAELNAWSPIQIEEVRDPSSTGADLLAAGQIIGWVQGRSEFGARALGNRSILADPRPSANRERVNELIKRREAFRPFAPSVMVERMSEYFEATQPLPYMCVTVPVRERYRRELGAVTHVDGTARVQSVSRSDNPKFWELLREFEKRSGFAVVLNTSFNNDAEPIVDTVGDAMNTLLTSDLDAVIVGDFVVRKRPHAVAVALRTLIPRLGWRYRIAFARLRGQAVATIERRDRWDELDESFDQEAILQLATSALRREPLGDHTGMHHAFIAMWTKRVFTLHPAG